MQAAFEPSFKRLVVVIAGEDLVLSLADRLRLQITAPYIAYNRIQNNPNTMPLKGPTAVGKSDTAVEVAKQLQLQGRKAKS